MIQNLKDAGCSSNIIEEVLRLYKNGQIQDAIKTLRRHRCSLMDSLHESQEKVDCLDFLVWSMEKGNQSNGDNKLGKDGNKK